MDFGFERNAWHDANITTLKHKMHVASLTLSQLYAALFLFPSQPSAAHCVTVTQLWLHALIAHG